MNKINTDILVLGGGPAGIQGSRTLKIDRPDMRVVMLRPEQASMIYCAIPYALEGLFPPEKALKKDELVTSVGVELIKEKAIAVDLDAHRVETREGTVIEYGKILIVTGADPIIPPVPGHTLDRIQTVKTENDMRRILSYIEGGAKKAVVIGAGAIGLEQAIAYRHQGLEVHLVDMADRILPNLTDADMSEPLRNIVEEKGIVLHFSDPLASFIGDGSVAGVTLASGETIELDSGSDFVIVSVGMKPEISLFTSQLKYDRDGLIVNDAMETSHRDAWAAGDCVSGWSAIDGKRLGGKLATNAVPMAKVAAANILGQNRRYPGFVNGAVTVVGDTRIGGTGFTESFAKTRGFDPVTAFGETDSRFPMMPGAAPVRVKLIADGNGRIIGGQVRGKEAVAERVDIITLAIQNNIDVHQLAQLSYSAQPWQTFFPARNAIVQAATELSRKIS